MAGGEVDLSLSSENEGRMSQDPLGEEPGESETHAAHLLVEDSRSLLVAGKGLGKG